MADDPQTGDESEGKDPFAQFGLPFDISGIEVMEPLCDDYFVEMLVAEGGRKGE